MNNKEANQGFTLIEMIAVLVIIVILASIVSPAFIRYVDKTRDKNYVAHAEAAVTAAQAELRDAYNSGALVLTAEEKQQWVDKMQFEGEVKLSVATVADATTVQEGNERAAYTIASAWYIEDGNAVYYDGKQYYNRNVSSITLPIVLADPEGLEDSTLLVRN